jgi:hypothetical protein
MVMNCGLVRLLKEGTMAPLKYLPDIRLRRFISETIRMNTSAAPRFSRSLVLVLPLDQPALCV